MTGDAMIVVGAGHAAVRAALSLRDSGHSGPIAMIATEGVDAPYERPPLSKWSQGNGVNSVPIAPNETLVNAKIERVCATVERIEPATRRVILSEGRLVKYDRLLLATGARPRRLNLAVLADTAVHYLRDSADANAIHSVASSTRSAVIIGGGFIGLELAASLRGMGVEVHVLELEQRLLSRAITADVAKIVQDLHVANGVQFHFGAQIADYKKPGSIVLKNGTEINVDLIIAGVGSIPNTALAEDAGLEVKNGIVVDAEMRTSDPNVFAAGDCCSYPLYGDPERMTRLESWKTAGDQGALAGGNMTGDTPNTYRDVPWFWSSQYDHVLQVSGLSTPDADTVERHYSDDHHVSFRCNPDGSLESACGIAPGTKIAKDNRASRLCL